jgi:RNA polymerase sigma factor (sigma-70 family)
VAYNNFLTKHNRLNPEQQSLVVNHVAMVRAMAHSAMSNKPKNILYEDLVSAGTVGLCEAALRFDPSRGAKFSTLAYHRIRGAISDEVRRSVGKSRLEAQDKASRTLFIEDMRTEFDDGSVSVFEPGDDGTGARHLENLLTVRELLDLVSPSESSFIDRIFNARKQCEAARSLGITKTRASIIKHRVLNKIQRAAA